MKFADLAPGDAVFVDANVFVYHFAPEPVTGLCQQPGLLITGALSVALMQTHGEIKIASDDADFDRVSGITRYSPM
jgi:predicted nucleic acid-binding protein